MEADQEQSHLRIDLLKCIERLSEREREFIELWEHGVGEPVPGNLTQTEIAAQWQMSNANVTKIKNRAILQLRECMSDKGYA